MESQMLPRDEFDRLQAEYVRTWCEMDRCLYGFFGAHIDHTQEEFVHAKVLLVNRCYQAYAHLRIKEEDLSKRLCQLEWLDKEIAAVIPALDFEDWALKAVVELHRRLVDKGHEWCGAKLESFFSKYLHFHCPKVVPIYDSRSWRALNDFFPKKLKANRGYYYEGFCACYLELYQHLCTSYQRSITIREIDVVLYFKGDPKKVGSNGGES